MTIEERTKQDAIAYHRVMKLLRDLRMEHGNCVPKKESGRPIACTHCAAEWELAKLVADYRGAPVRVC